MDHRRIVAAVEVNSVDAPVLARRASFLPLIAVVRDCVIRLVVLKIEERLELDVAKRAAVVLKPLVGLCFPNALLNQGEVLE